MTGGAIFPVKKLLLIASLLFLSACNPATMIEDFADDEKELAAREYIQRLIDGDTAALAAEVDPSLQSPDLIARLENVRSFLPKEPPTTTNLIGYFVHKTGTDTQYNVTFQFGYGSKWVLANAAWKEPHNCRRLIVGLNAQALPQSLQEINAFSFKRAGLQHYLFLTAVVLIPLFTVVTLIVCILTKLPKRKWLWILCILIGVTKISLNWTTGQVGIALMFLQLGGAGASAASVYSPWILSFSIPLGAILFWVKRHSLQNPPAELPPTVLPPPLDEPNSPAAN